MRDLLARWNARRDEIIQRIVVGLRSSGAQSYRSAEEQVVRTRVERLFDAFTRSLGDGPCRFVEYVHTLAVERIAEGYLLRELQRALNLLGEEAWQVAAEPAGGLSETVQRLALVSGTIGYAKDQLARDYLEQKEVAESALVGLRARTARLFQGTDPSELPEDLLAVK
jgi:hypothetical protein